MLSELLVTLAELHFCRWKRGWTHLEVGLGSRVYVTLLATRHGARAIHEYFQRHVVLHWRRKRFLERPGTWI